MPQVKSQSVDTVISTHVLCSVASIAETLKEITRILKPRGRFVFFEHTIAEEGLRTSACGQRHNTLKNIPSLFV
jgi:ubiquinone/menaquinone biosynthesis C-methylase UbiE